MKPTKKEIEKALATFQGLRPSDRLLCRLGGWLTGTIQTELAGNPETCGQMLVDARRTPPQTFQDSHPRRKAVWAFEKTRVDDLRRFGTGRLPLWVGADQ